MLHMLNLFIFLYIQWFNPNKIYEIKVQVKLYDMCKVEFDLYSLSSKIRFKKICHNLWDTLYKRKKYWWLILLSYTAINHAIQCNDLTEFFLLSILHGRKNDFNASSRF